MDGFNDRVGKVFDCISSSSSKGAAAWSLSDAQIQRQTWNRDKGNKSDITIINKDDDETLVSSSFHNLFKKPPNKSNNKKKKNNTFDDPDDDFEDDDDDDEAGDDKIDDLDIRSSIGLDPTLDFEEEEDEYDKIAAGTENANGPLLYMKDVTHHAPFLNSHNILHHHTFTTTSTNNNNDNDDDQPMFNAPSQPSLDNALKLKSILKRKREDLGKPSPKRVRFDPTCKHHDAPQLDAVPVPQVSNNQRSRVPDYLVNPSKYTRYTFNEDDDDDDKSSNTEAYYDFLDQIKKSKDVGLEQKPPAADLPASVVFIPRKKRGDAAPSNSDGQVKESSTGVGIGIGIAAVEVQQDEVSDIMLQDEPDVDAVCAKPKFQKPSRQYRSKVEDHDTVS